MKSFIGLAPGLIYPREALSLPKLSTCCHDSQHNDTKLFVTLSMRNTQHNDTQNKFSFSDSGAIMPSRYTEYPVPLIVMLNVILRSAFVLHVMSPVAPLGQAPALLATIRLGS